MSRIDFWGWLFFAGVALFLLALVWTVPPTLGIGQSGNDHPYGADWEPPEDESAIGVYSASALNGSGDYVHTFEANETITVKYKIENVGGEAGWLNRTAEIYGPWNNSTGIIETDYYDSSNVSVRVPAEETVVVTTNLTAPPEPGVYQYDIGSSSWGCVLDDGIRRVEVGDVNGE